MSCLFDLRDVGMRFGSAEVLRSINLSFAAGEFVALAGPNGAGKSTLLSMMGGLSKPTSGECTFLGREAYRWNRRAFARRVSMVMPTREAAFPFTAEDMVYMGRTPHRSGLYESLEDHAAVEKALATTETMQFRQREFRTLSDGEKQRVLLASALAQSPEVLLLDEPSAHLDLHHQVSLYKLLHRLSRQGLLVIAVTHDLNVAAAQADRLVLLYNGQMRANGRPIDVICPELMSEVFQVKVELLRTASGQPWISYGE